MQVSFNGLDTPLVGDGPDFVKALNIDHALDGEVMLAWQMNGANLPLLNGCPVRLIVPGYYVPIGSNTCPISSSPIKCSMASG